MIFLWEIPENFLNRDIGEYDYDCSPDRFLLRKGLKLTIDEFNPTPVVNFEVSKDRVLKFDCLPNNTLIPLVNEKIKVILEQIAPNDVQFFPAKLICSNGELESYYFLNIIHSVLGIDHEKSIYTKTKTVDAILGFNYLTYKDGCMGEFLLARDQEYLGNLLLTEKIKNIFDKESITGVLLVRPEDYYHPLNEML